MRSKLRKSISLQNLNKILDSLTTAKFENCDMKLDKRFSLNSEKKFVKMVTKFYQISKGCSRELETCRPMPEGPLSIFFKRFGSQLSNVAIIN